VEAREKVSSISNIKHIRINIIRAGKLPEAKGLEKVAKDLMKMSHDDGHFH
jgi:hypothetical protein